MQSLWMVVAALFYAFYAVFVKYSGFEGIGSWEILFFRSIFGVVLFYGVMRFSGITLSTTHPWQHLIRSMCGTLSHLFRLSSEYRAGDDIELHLAAVCRSLHSDDLPAPSRSGELGTDGDGAFRFYRRRDHARTNHRTARILCRCSGFSRGLLHGKCHNIC